MKLAKEVHYREFHRDLPVVSEAEWQEARKKLLEKEVELSRMKDEVLQARQKLPATKLEEGYVFEDADAKGKKVHLSSLFGEQQDLGIYHMMWEPSDDSPCPVCTEWVTGIDGVLHNLKERMSVVVVARAPWQKLAALKKKQGWTFRFLSSASNSFNEDFGVSGNDHAAYNFGKGWYPAVEKPGWTVLSRQGKDILKTYQTFARGLENINLSLAIFDTLPDGRMGVMK